MRPIKVEFQAFGPYVGYEKVDLEALSRKGLFLICGKTGIGKTRLQHTNSVFGTCDPSSLYFLHIGVSGRYNYDSVRGQFVVRLLQQLQMPIMEGIKGASEEDCFLFPYFQGSSPLLSTWI